MHAPALAALIALASLLSIAPARAATITLGGEAIEYRAQPGTIGLKRDDGRPRGSIFYTAYVRGGLDADQRAARPVAFLFNGGPGSSSAWLHLGAFGPRRLVLGEAGLKAPDEPFRTTANEHSLLDVADLVFIDPIGTGFSRAVDPVTARGFYNFRADVRAVAEFIKLYLDGEKRTGAPCIIVGESYGAMRACGLAPELEERHGIVVNGLVLVSGPIVMGSNPSPDLLLPTAAATAHYHGLLGGDLQALDRGQLVERVGEFVTNAYRPALDGADLGAATTEQIVSQLRAFTGLQDLRGLKFSMREVRVNISRRLDVEAVGIYDTRVTSKDRRGLFRGATGDPAMDVIRDPMEAVMRDYLTRDLGYATELDYRLLTRIPIWSHSGSVAAATLGRALQTNRGLHVLIASGYYDTVTPLSVVRRAVEDAKIAPDQRDNIRFKRYEGGHMMYTNVASLELLSRDVRAFIREAAGRKRGPALIPTALRSACDLVPGG